MDDRELNHLLREWKAPDTPAFALRAGAGKPAPVLPRWTWLLTGTIRVPVPVGLAAALLLAFWLYASRDGQPVEITQPASTQPVVSLADFQPVETVELRVVGEVK